MSGDPKDDHNMNRGSVKAMTELQPKIDGILVPSYFLPLFHARSRKTYVSVGKIYLEIDGLHVSFRLIDTRQLRITIRVSVCRLIVYLSFG